MLFVLTSIAVHLNLSGFSIFVSFITEVHSHGCREKWWCFASCILLAQTEFVSDEFLACVA